MPISNYEPRGSGWAVRAGRIDVWTAEAAASKTTEAATATAPRLVRAVRREDEQDWSKERRR